MKHFFTLAFFSSSLILQAQETRINGKITPYHESVQLFENITPFDQNVNLLAEIEVNSEGDFEYIIEDSKDQILEFKIGDARRSVSVTSGADLTLSLEIEKLDKPDAFGNRSNLLLTSLTSTNPVIEKLFNIEEDIESIKENNRGRNGRLSSKYSWELYDYWNETLLSSDKNLVPKLINSTSFAHSISYLKKFGSKDQFQSLEKTMHENLEYNYFGFYVIARVYSNNILIEYLTKQIGKTSYFSFTDKSLKSFGEDHIRLPLKLSLIASSLGRKWANQKIATERLKEFMVEVDNKELLELANLISELHHSDIIGAELTNFTFSNVVSSEKINLDDYRGEYLLLDFWATWCGPCIKSMRKLPELKSKLKTDLNILCVTTEKDVTRVQNFVEKSNYKEALTFALSNQEEQLRSYFNMRAIPLYFLVDPDGIVVGKAVSDPAALIKEHIN